MLDISNVDSQAVMCVTKRKHQYEHLGKMMWVQWYRETLL